MSRTPKQPDSKPKDGFDLIEYPCDFPFKAMCRADERVSAEEHIRGLVTPLLNDNTLIDLKSTASRTGKFESVTLTVRLQTREELEAIYALIAQSPRVVMTL